MSEMSKWFAVHLQQGYLQQPCLVSRSEINFIIFYIYYVSYFLLKNGWTKLFFKNSKIIK